MTDVREFMDEMAAEYGERLTLLEDCGERRATEDAIALLTDHRLGVMDEAGFENLLRALRAGRSPVGMAVLKPQEIADALERRWRDHGAQSAHAQAAAPALVGVQGR